MKKIPPIWFLLIAGLTVRLAALILVPAGHTAPDEASYFQSGMRLFHQHQQMTFRPPLPGWIAWLLALAGLPSLRAARLVSVMMDTANIGLIWLLARRVFDERREFVAFFAAAVYAFYLPAISYAIFLLTEVQAVFFILLMAWMGVQDSKPVLRGLAMGLALALAMLARPNLLPLALTLPAFVILVQDRERGRGEKIILAAAFALPLVLGVGGYMARNYAVEGRAAIANNAAYNLYIGNRQDYQEDLNLFHPWPTPEQISYRKKYLAEGGPKIARDYDRLQRLGMEFIIDDPALFARRALGRLARLLAPKTSVLEIIGGERKARIFSPAPLALLLLANLQYGLALFGGAAGVVLLWARQRKAFWLMAAVTAGALPLCLVAISHPRFSFPVEPFLLMALGWIVTEPRRSLADLRADRRALIVYLSLVLFFAWSWAAWAIFSFSSRMSIY